MRFLILLSLVLFFAFGCIRVFAPTSEQNSNLNNENAASFNQNVSGETEEIANVNTESGNSTVVCLADVKQCPDGSFVPRLPPACAFAPCPE